MSHVSSTRDLLLELQKLKEIPAGSQARYNKSFKDFVMEMTGIPILGYRDIPGFIGDDKHRPFNRVHLKIMNILENKELLRILALVARQHAKTTNISDLYPAWEVLLDPSVRIMIISYRKNVAETAINNATTYLKSCGVKFEQDKVDQKTVVRPRKGLLSREPTLMAYGYESEISGKHCDILILDDTVVLENSYTQYQRSKYEEFFGAQVSQVLESTGRLIVTGVRWRHADFHGVLADPLKHPEFHVGCTLDNHVGCIIAPACDKNFQNVIWPEKWNEAMLRKREKDIGPLFFASQFRLDPSGMEGGTFKIEWLLDNRYVILPKLRFKAMGVDPSRGQGQNFFCIAVIGLGEDNKVYVLDFLRENISIGQQPESVMNMYERYRPTKVRIESFLYQKSLKDQFSEEIKKRGLEVDIRGEEAPINKEVRIANLNGPFYSGKILFPKWPENVTIPGWWEDFKQEYVQFPTGETDDMLDALFYAFKAADIYTGSVSMGDYHPMVAVGDSDKRQEYIDKRVVIRRPLL